MVLKNRGFTELKTESAFTFAHKKFRLNSFNEVKKF